MTARASDRAREATEHAHWGMLALAWLVYFAFGVVSASLFPLVTPIRNELGLSYSQFGLILGVWQLVYIGVAAPIGALIDRVGTKRSLTIGALVVAISGFARSFAVDFPTLLGAVALFGIGGPVISIGLPKLIAEWFTGRTRSIASGIYATGVAAGAIAALSLTNSLLIPLTDSWRATLSVYGLVALLIAFVWIVFGRENDSAGERRGRAGRQESARSLLRHSSVLLVVMIGFSGFLSNHGLRSWLPEIFESKGFSPAAAGLLASVPNLTGIAGSILILRLVSPRNRQAIILALLAATALSMVIIALSDGTVAALATAIYGFCTGSLTPLLLNTLMDLPAVGSRAMGVAGGLYFAVGEVGGFLGPTLVGYFTDATGSFSAGMFVLAAAMAIALLPALRLTADVPEPVRT